ncbi:DUF5107 domain-containing protein, partial [Lachnospiraceae bacterium OttesenSCG-928-E19]|nr:DUF5107 domain-containing protein [Lachnospiraceae bacterium OttesenSCG-928-E19]
MAISIDSMKLSRNIVAHTNPLPYFRDEKKHETPKKNNTLQKEDLDHFGYEMAFRILPYQKRDRYMQDSQQISATSIILENDFLMASFLPEYGGRLYSLYDKQNKKELLFSPSSISPSSLSSSGDAWFPGGISFNNYSTFEPVFFAKVCGENDYEFLRMYNYERTGGTVWQIDFHLPEGAKELYAHVTIYNDQDFSVPLSWRTVISLTEDASCRFFSGTKDVLFPIPDSKRFQRTFSYGRATLPNIPQLGSSDASFVGSLDKAGAYFLQNPTTAEAPWSSIVYEDGHGFLERSTQPMRSRGVTYWGNESPGKYWKQLLQNSEEHSYLEVSSLLTPTPLHGMDIAARDVISYTQGFGAITLNSDDAMEPSYELSHAIVNAVVNTVIPAGKVTELHKTFSLFASLPCSKVLFAGTGWGALENTRRIMSDAPILPEHLFFPAESFTEEQYDWLALLSHEELPELQENELPLAWMVDINYLPLLKDYIVKYPESVKARLHAGIILYENGFPKDAVKIWQEALRIRSLPILSRNLSYSASSAGFTLEALSYMEHIHWASASNLDVAFWEEYFELLLEDGHYRKM